MVFEENATDVISASPGFILHNVMFGFCFVMITQTTPRRHKSTIIPATNPPMITGSKVFFCPPDELCWLLIVVARGSPLLCVLLCVLNVSKSVEYEFPMVSKSVVEEASVVKDSLVVESPSVSNSVVVKAS